jgi:hypothetical protein
MVSAERSGIPPVEARNLGRGPSINQGEHERSPPKFLAQCIAFSRDGGGEKNYR